MTLSCVLFQIYPRYQPTLQYLFFIPLPHPVEGIGQLVNSLGSLGGGDFFLGRVRVGFLQKLGVGGAHLAQAGNWKEGFV